MCGCLSRPLLGTWPSTQACALDWESNQWSFDSQVGTQPLSHISQGCAQKFDACPHVYIPTLHVCICIHTLSSAPRSSPRFPAHQQALSCLLPPFIKLPLSLYINFAWKNYFTLSIIHYLMEAWIPWGQNSHLLSALEESRQGDWYHQALSKIPK